MTVIAHGQGLGLVVRQGLEPGEGGFPFRRAQAAQPDAGGGELVAEAQLGLREGRGLHRVGEIGAQGGEAGIRAIGRGDGHGPQMALSRRRGKPDR